MPSLKDFIAEERKKEGKYTEEKTRGEIDKVILTLEGSDAAQVTGLARRWKRLKKSAALLAEADAKLKAKAGGMFLEVFDESKDIWVTRVMQTASFTMTMAKQQQEKEKVEVDYKKIIDGLKTLLDKDLQAKLDELIAANTKKWMAKAPAAGITIKDLDESVIDAAKGVMGKMITALQKGAAALKAKFMAWGKTYDAKLDELKEELKGKPVVATTEAKAPNKLAAFLKESEELYTEEDAFEFFRFNLTEVQVKNDEKAIARYLKLDKFKGKPKPTEEQMGDINAALYRAQDDIG